MGGNTLGDGKGGVKTNTTATISPEALIAAAQRAGGPSTAKTSGDIITGVSLGQDPVTGKPITGVVFTPGSEESYIKRLPPQDRIAFQKKMFALGIYPKGFKPTFDGMVTKEDFDAVAKLISVGEQRGKGDLNEIINIAKKEPKVLNYLRTGGYAPTGTVVVTDTKEAASNLNDYFLNLFNDKPSKEEIKAYQTALNTRERSAKGGVSQQERQDIILSVANSRITKASQGALAGDIAAKDVLDSGSIGRRVREIRQAYDNNGITVSDRTVYNLAGKSIRSQEAYDNILEDINQNATLQWGQLATGLKPGQDMRSKLQPYITLRSQIRGIPEDQIKVSDMEDVMNADGTFKRPAEYKTNQYKSNDYLQSQAYKDTVLNDTQVVLRNFGIGS
jgi:hypothetical protein